MTTATAEQVFAGLLHATLSRLSDFKDLLPELVETEQAALAWAEQIAAAGARTASLSPYRVSPFTMLYQRKNNPAARWLGAVPLRLTPEVVFPQKQETLPNSLPPAIIEMVRQELDAVSTWENAGARLQAALDVCQRAFWAVSSPVYPGQEPDVSLYDYGRVVAALLPCYAADRAEDVPVATLLHGDISGVQAFIYTITARGATSGLRGRSVYLQFLTEAIARYVLDQLGLPPTSLLYASGGHFYLLAPATLAQPLADLQRAISQKLLRHHEGELFVALGATQLTAEDFQPENFAAAWRRASRAVSRAKQRRFHGLGDDMFNEIFAIPKEDTGERTDECQVCHHIGDIRVDRERQNADGTFLRKCTLCDAFEALGNELRQAQVVALRPVTAVAAKRSNVKAALAEFGLEVDIFGPDDLARLNQVAVGVRLWALHDESARQARAAVQDREIPVLLRYMVNVTPTVREEDLAAQVPEDDEGAAAEQARVGRVKPFDLLQQQARGIKRLGVLRMDVDDLGLVFSRGFGEQGGLLRTVAMSWAMSIFFEGWVSAAIEAVQQQGDTERDVIYAIYSGGDDLFLVGAWDVLPHLALQLADDFAAYATHHPEVHLSGGLTLHGGKFPLYQAARAAGEALDAAKSYAQNGSSKNAFTFLGRTHAWAAYRDSAVPQGIVAEYERLTDLAAAGSVQNSLIRNLQRLDALYADHKEWLIRERKPLHVIYWGRWHWICAYQLTRLASRMKNETQQQIILDIRDRLSGDQFRYIDRLGLAARWVELTIRNS